MKKRVSFHMVKLFDVTTDVELDHSILREIIIEIIVNSTTVHVDEKGNILYRSLDLTPEGEQLHITADIFEYENNGFFCRLGKQTPQNGFIRRNYITLEQGELLPGENEDLNGIEQYTYGYFDYETGIFSIVTSRGTVNENVFKSIISRYNNNYFIRLAQIPNGESIESIYLGIRPSITNLVVEVPMPSAQVLEEVFGWNNRDVLNAITVGGTTAVIELKGPERCRLTSDGEISKGIIDSIRGNLGRYTKAKFRGKTNTIKAREYNFFEEYFSYPIDISNYHVVDYTRVAYTIDELAELYRINLRAAFNENRYILCQITGR